MPRIGLRALFATILLLAAPLPASAQDYPTRPLRMIVPFPAGAGPDLVARLLAEHLRESLGQPVVIDNRPGALGSIGALEIARAAPDGHTLGIITNSTHASNVSMFRRLAYDPIGDFELIGRVITTAMVLLVRPEFPARDFAEFLEYARRHPNTMSGGYGSGAAQMSLARLRSAGGVLAEPVPYRGVPLAVADVIQGSLTFSLADYAISLQQMQGNTLRGLAVTSATRSELMPELPAMAEVLPGFDVTIWYGFAAPARTPQPIVQRLAALTAEFFERPATRERMAAIGLSTAVQNPQQFREFVRSEIVKWTAAAREAGIEPQ
jgi:tripartite-type tricarboxylate transporter receptor subunit TctC